ncbi:MAG: glycosyltransferase family 2 protein [Magnetococcales bacterium]|nr:glycosyltransferase family 2 protein [Magnetococcales bacterium]
MSKDPSYLPDISVIVACYNQGRWVERCVRSINHQEGLSPGTFEILVVDDGSGDHTQEVLGNLAIVRNLRVLVHEINQGLPIALNNAIRQARGRYVVRVDADDYLNRSCLHIMKLFLDVNRQYQAVAVDYVKVDHLENALGRFNCMEDQIACGIMFRKECLFDIGLYNPEFRMREGHELRRRFEEKYRIGRLEFPFYKYRHHATNRTHNHEDLAVYDQKLREMDGSIPNH